MKKTRLFECQKSLGGKMIEFFGWNMPVEFKGIIDEHMTVRKKAGLFDVSHMGEISVKGPEALQFLQYLTPNDVSRLFPIKAQYTALTTEKGTFVDDLLIYCLGENDYLLVVNAANTEKDYEWIVSRKGEFNVWIENESDRYTQMALQGPKALEILQPLTELRLDEMKMFGASWGSIAGEKVLISRTGYTGEDGFEIYTLSLKPERIYNLIMKSGKPYRILPIGLGARDTLRLESSLLLYGNDIDDATTVLEAGLGWLVKFKKGDFLGSKALLEQKEKGIKKKIVGFEITGRGIARSHYPVFIRGEKLSEVTSGTYSPYLKKSIGLTYLPIKFTEVDTEIAIEVRGKLIPAKIIPLPFYKREMN
ncbi:MAG: glycine cleavage system aminomethyltransferase GcvT [Candidatus Aminicenantaceae bacterium]